MEYLGEILGSLIGVIAGGGLTGLIAWRAIKRKAYGEATQTEADAMKSVQDVYQQTIADLQEYNKQLRLDRDRLREDRNEMRRENDELRKRQDELAEKIRQLEYEVSRNRKMVETLSPFLCGRLNCSNRTKVDLGNESFDEKKTTKGKRLSTGIK